MRVAIFGANGMIGREVVKAAPKGCELLILRRLEFDITKPESYSKKLEDFKPDSVVNLAAKLGTMLSPYSTEEMLEVNAAGALKAARAAKDAGAKSYIFTSSTVVHGENEKGRHHGRFDGFAPKHPYSESKAAAERELDKFSKEGDGMTIVTLRPPMVIGENPKITLPLEEFVIEAAAGRDIKIFGTGDHEREFVSAADVASGIWKAVEWSLSAQKGYHPFFLTGNRISMKDLAETVAKRYGVKVIYAPKTKQAFSLTTDPSDSWKTLGWKPEDGIDEMIDGARKRASSGRPS